MKVLSLFDGMSCGQIALNKLGLEDYEYYASEIDKYAITVTQHNYPNTIQLGDVKNVYYKDGILYSENGEFNVGKIDLIMGGSPCTDFSFAGKRNGMATKDKTEITTLEQYLELKAEGFEFVGQSYLFWEYMRLLNEVNPTYFLLENVKMVQKWESTLSNAIGVEPININSNLVSAQNRNRFYWTNIPNVTIPEDKNITWGDVREHGVDTEKYYYTEKAMQWLGRASQKKNKTLDIHLDDEKMQMIEASHAKKYSNQRFFGIVDYPIDEQVVAAMRGRYLVNGIRQDHKMKTAGKTTQYIEFRYDGKTNALTTVQKDNVVVPFTLPDRIPRDDFFFRYITPLECERLQTVPDNYTSVVSDTQRYRMLGNGWTVDVIKHILKNIIQ